MDKYGYQCRCSECQAKAPGAIAQEHRMINQLVQLLNEKQRRHFVGLLAKQYGHGGIERMAEISGLHRATISRGQKELASAAQDDRRVRSRGGGRKLSEKKIPSY